MSGYLDAMEQASWSEEDLEGDSPLKGTVVHHWEIVSASWHVVQSQGHGGYRGVGWWCLNCPHSFPHSEFSPTAAHSLPGIITFPVVKEDTALVFSSIFMLFIKYLLLPSCWMVIIYLFIYFTNCSSEHAHWGKLSAHLPPYLCVHRRTEQWNLRKCWFTKCVLQVPWANWVISFCDNQKTFRMWRRAECCKEKPKHDFKRSSVLMAKHSRVYCQ